MIRTRFAAQSEMRAYKRGRQFCYQFFHAIGVVAEPLAQFAVAALRVRCPVPGFMRARTVVVHRSEERGKWGQGDCVISWRVECSIALMHNARVDPLKELLSRFDSFLDWRLSVNLRRVSVYLRHVEYVVLTAEQQTGPRAYL